MEKVKRNIKPFDGDKYSIGNLECRALLAETDALKVVDVEVLDPVTQEWKKTERSPKSLIIEFLSDALLVNVTIIVGSEEEITLKRHC